MVSSICKRKGRIASYGRTEDIGNPPDKQGNRRDGFLRYPKDQKSYGRGS